MYVTLIVCRLPRLVKSNVSAAEWEAFCSSAEAEIEKINLRLYRHDPVTRSVIQVEKACVQHESVVMRLRMQVESALLAAMPESIQPAALPLLCIGGPGESFSFFAKEAHHKLNFLFSHVRPSTGLLLACR